MSKKEEKAREYVSHIPSGVYKILENDIDRMQWISEIENTFIAGWDAAKQEAIECLKTILSLRSDVHPAASEHIIELVEREMEK